MKQCGQPRALRTPAARIVLPCAALLVIACIQIEVKLADQFAAQVIDSIEAHVGMPHRRGLFADRYGKQCFDHLEQPGQYALSVKYCFSSWSEYE